MISLKDLVVKKSIIVFTFSLIREKKKMFYSIYKNYLIILINKDIFLIIGFYGTKKEINDTDDFSFIWNSDSTILRIHK